MKKIRKILFLPAWYPWPADELSGLFVKFHALALLKHYQIAVIQVIALEKNQNLLPHSMSNEDGIFTIRRYFHKPASKILFPFYALNFLIHHLLAYQTLIINWGKPDISHIHVLTREGILAFILKKIYAIPYFITEHWSRYLPKNKDSYKGFFKKSLTKIICKNASGISAVSEELKQAMIKHNLGIDNFKVISNVVNTKKFYPAPEKRSEIFRFLHVSCFDEKPKNIKGILNSIKQFLLNNHFAEFIFVGDGKDFKEVHSYAQEIGILNQVKFVGIKMGEELVNEFHKAHAFILFSNYENQPVVILESLACGIPVIATRVGSIPQMINQENGILINSGDENALLDSMILIKNNYHKYDPNKISSDVEKKFGFEGVANEFKTWYESGKI